MFDTIVHRDDQVEAHAERNMPVAGSGQVTAGADLYARLADETLAKLRLTHAWLAVAGWSSCLSRTAAHRAPGARFFSSPTAPELLVRAALTSRSFSKESVDLPEAERPLSIPFGEGATNLPAQNSVVGSGDF